jgi:hypothetical protein
LIAEVVVKNKEVAVILTPPLASLGFLPTPLAPKREKPKTGRAFTIRVIFSLSVSDEAEYGSTYSGREHPTLADGY